MKIIIYRVTEKDSSPVRTGSAQSASGAVCMVSPNFSYPDTDEILEAIRQVEETKKLFFMDVNGVVFFHSHLDKLKEEVQEYSQMQSLADF